MPSPTRGRLPEFPTLECSRSPAVDLDNGFREGLGAFLRGRSCIEDVARLMGHSTVRVTRDLYIFADGHLFERFFRATE